MLVDHNCPALIEVYAKRVQAEPSGVRALPHADDRVRATEAATVGGLDEHMIVVNVNVGDARVHLDLNAAREESLLHDLGDIFVLGGQHLRARGQQCDLATRRGVELGVLTPRCASTNDEQVRGCLAQIEDLTRRKDAIMVKLCKRGDPGTRAGGDQQIVVLNLRCVAIAIDVDHAWFCDHAAPMEHPHRGLCESIANPSRLVGGDPTRMGNRPQHVDVRLAMFEDDARLVGSVDRSQHRRCREQCLRRNQIRQRTRASEPAVLDQRYLGAESGRSGCCCIARRSSTQNHEAHRQQPIVFCRMASRQKPIWRLDFVMGPGPITKSSMSSRGGGGFCGRKPDCASLSPQLPITMIIRRAVVWRIRLGKATICCVGRLRLILITRIC